MCICHLLFPNVKKNARHRIDQVNDISMSLKRKLSLKSWLYLSKVRLVKRVKDQKEASLLTVLTENTSGSGRKVSWTWLLSFCTPPTHHSFVPFQDTDPSFL